MFDHTNLDAIEARLLTGWPMCIDCGIVQIDEDGCCGTCGRDAILPSTDDAHDCAPTDLQALIAYVRVLESALAARDERIRALVEAGDLLDWDLTHGCQQYDEDITAWRLIAHQELEEMTP